MNNINRKFPQCPESPEESLLNINNICVYLKVKNNILNISHSFICLLVDSYWLNLFADNN